MFHVDVDACRFGWFAVSLEADHYSFEVFRDISGLWNRYKDAKLMLIDIPIGLRERDTKERLCDKEARKLLDSKRVSSVFHFGWHIGTGFVLESTRP